MPASSGSLNGAFSGACIMWGSTDVIEVVEFNSDAPAMFVCINCHSACNCLVRLLDCVIEFEHSTQFKLLAGPSSDHARKGV